MRRVPGAAASALGAGAVGAVGEGKPSTVGTFE
jgi:hypothetical protein